MLFNSINYFLFLPTVFIINYILPDRFRWMLLLAGSIFFYMTGGAATIVVPIIIILNTFFVAKLMDRTSNADRKKTYFLSGLFIILGILIFYKYINFILSTSFDGFNFINHLVRGEQAFNKPSFILQFIVPLGISYITFQAIAYLIEIYRGAQNPEKHLGYFATYLMFFPKLLSGPIERAHNFIPQLYQKRPFDYDQVVSGLKRILFGLFKVMVVANHLSLLTDAVFNNVHQHTGITLLFASFFFMVQLYSDFSGYTDMAIGSAQMLGFRLMENFDKPYVSKSTTELWRRWHISLSTWFNEYVFNPIVVKRRYWNQWAVVYGSIITFLLLGLWHGASWNFIIFGLLQALALSLEFLTKTWRKRIRKHIPGFINSSFGVFYVLSFFSFSLMFFRANTFDDAIYVLTHSLGGIGITVKNIILFQSIEIYIGSKYEILVSFTSMGLMILGDNFFADHLSLNSFRKKPIILRWLIYVSMILIILYFGIFDTKPFIYFQF
jgi:alginate O-acetyltransferase complex protein AlgI